MHMNLGLRPQRLYPTISLFTLVLLFVVSRFNLDEDIVSRTQSYFNSSCVIYFHNEKGVCMPLVLECERLSVTLWKSQQLFLTTAGIYASQENVFDTLCHSWYENDAGGPSDVLECPSRLEVILNSSLFVPDPISGSLLQYYHPGAEYSFRQKTASPSKAGAQCIYGEGGKLLEGPPGGGSLDVYSPSGISGVIKHQIYDVLPWFICCKWSERLRSCMKYYEKRP